MLQTALMFDTEREYLDFKVLPHWPTSDFQGSVRGLMRPLGIDFEKVASDQHPPIMTNLHGEVYPHLIVLTL